MTQEEYTTLPAAQKQALDRLFLRQEREAEQPVEWEQFRELAYVAGRIGTDYVGVGPVFGMFFGIEVDGYTHT